MCFKNSITKPSPPAERIKSGWGDISMYEWCCAVAAEAHGVVVEEDGLVAVIKVEG